MAQDDFTAFSRNLNPFRSLERQIDSLFDDSFGAGAAGAMARNHPPIANPGADPTEDAADPARQSLFLRVVQLNSMPRRPR